MNEIFLSPYIIDRTYLTYSNNFYLPWDHVALKRHFTPRPTTMFHFKSVWTNGIVKTRPIEETEKVYYYDHDKDESIFKYTQKKIKKIHLYNQKAIDFLSKYVVIEYSLLDGDNKTRPYKEQFEINRHFYYVARSAQDGSYIGTLDETLHKINAGVTQFYKIEEHCNVASIGYAPFRGEWHGWSHRAWTKFKIGHIVKKGSCCTTSRWTDEYLEEHPEEDKSLPVGFVAKTLDDCKRCAIAFAESVR